MGLLKYLFYECPTTGKRTNVQPATAYDPGAKLPMYSLFVDSGGSSPYCGCDTFHTAMVSIERCPQCGGDHDLSDD